MNFISFLNIFLSVLYHYISFYLYLYIHLLQPKQHLPGGLDPDIVQVEEGHQGHRPAGEGEDRELFEAGQVVEDEAGEEVGEGEGEEEHDCHRADMLEVVEDNQAGGQADEGKAGQDGGGVEDKVVQEERRGHCHNGSDLRKSYIYVIFNICKV